MRRRWLLAVVVLLPAGCGGGSGSPATRTSSVEQAVKRQLERGLMTSQPRTDQGSSPVTHVRQIHCSTTSGRAFSCEVTLGNGAHRRVTARERSDGEVVVG